MATSQRTEQIIDQEEFAPFMDTAIDTPGKYKHSNKRHREDECCHNWSHKVPNTDSEGDAKEETTAPTLIPADQQNDTEGNEHIEVQKIRQSSSNPGSHVDNSHSDMPEKLERMCDAVKTLLECIGECPDREGLRATPLRYAKAFLDLTKGYKVNEAQLVNEALFSENRNDFVVVKDITIHSLCEHHLLPFTGTMHIGYLPSETVIGLSKLPRLAEMYAHRLQIQERLTSDVAHAIMRILKPHGVMVVMEACHMCMVMRGVEKHGSSTVTSCGLGRFEKCAEKRSEFLSLVGLKGK
nr:gtp cyclohydrolase 1 [Quercus suber]